VGLSVGEVIYTSELKRRLRALAVKGVIGSVDELRYGDLRAVARIEVNKSAVSIIHATDQSFPSARNHPSRCSARVHTKCFDYLVSVSQPGCLGPNNRTFRLYWTPLLAAAFLFGSHYYISGCRWLTAYPKFSQFVHTRSSVTSCMDRRLKSLRRPRLPFRRTPGSRKHPLQDTVIKVTDTILDTVMNEEAKQCHLSFPLDIAPTSFTVKKLLGYDKVVGCKLYERLNLYSPRLR